MVGFSQTVQPGAFLPGNHERRGIDAAARSRCLKEKLSGKKRGDGRRHFWNSIRIPADFNRPSNKHGAVDAEAGCQRTASGCCSKEHERTMAGPDWLPARKPDSQDAEVTE